MNTFKFMDAYLFSPSFGINAETIDDRGLPQIHSYNQLKSKFWSDVKKDSISDVVISDGDIKSYIVSVDFIAKSFVCSEIETVKSRLLEVFDAMTLVNLNIIIDDYLFESTKFFHNAKEHYKDYPKILAVFDQVTTWKTIV